MQWQVCKQAAFMKAGAKHQFREGSCGSTAASSMGKHLPAQAGAVRQSSGCAQALPRELATDRDEAKRQLKVGLGACHLSWMSI